MTKGLIVQAFFRIVVAKRPGKGLILHTDRGSQFGSHAFSRLLDQFDMKGSTSRKGNCWTTHRR